MDFLPKITSRLAKTKSAIVIEDWAVRNMVRNRRLARHIADVSWAEYRRMLAYKTVGYGSQLTVAPSFMAYRAVPRSSLVSGKTMVPVGNCCEGTGRIRF